MNYLNKIFQQPDDLIRQVKDWKNKGLKIGFTNGCFDILHPGHVHYLYEASLLVDKLIIGVNTDASVSKLKGKHRPIQSQDARCRVLASLGSTAAIILFDEPTPLNLINAVLPDILIKGGDYIVEEIVGYNEVKNNGGKTITIPFLDGFSTSDIERKIIESHL